VVSNCDVTTVLLSSCVNYDPVKVTLLDETMNLKDEHVSAPERLTDDKHRGNKKLVRILTVLAYLFSVSFAALLLSLYYVLLWDPDMDSLIRKGAKMQEGKLITNCSTFVVNATDPALKAAASSQISGQ